MKLKHPNGYIDYREVRLGFATALDVTPEGHAVILALCAGVATAWEYHNIVAAMGAWHAWDPRSNVEPQGYAVRHDAESKIAVEAL